MFAHGGQEDRCDCGGDRLVDQKRDAHAIGADARGHEFRKGQPHTNSGADRKEGHEEIECDGHQPAILLAGHRSD